jgi:ATP-binding cassette subfamily B multidrug efflux pump
MVVGTAGSRSGSGMRGISRVGIVAMALPLTWQIANIAGWVAQNVTAIFENVGVVQDGMRSIAVPRQMPDKPDAVELVARRRDPVRRRALRLARHATARRRCCRHRFGRSRRASASGWWASRAPASRPWSMCCCASTILEAGRILIDGQDIAGVTQESLRAQIAMVTQDTSLLHRSIRENIRYGRPSGQRRER